MHLGSSISVACAEDFIKSSSNIENIDVVLCIDFEGVFFGDYEPALTSGFGLDAGAGHVVCGELA